MDGVGFLEIFLLVNVFIIGAISATAVRHAWAHFHPKQPKVDKPPVQTLHIAPEIKDQLLKKAQSDFEKVVSKSVEELQGDLSKTASELNEQLEKLGAQVVKTETERYTTMLENLRTQVQTVITTAQSDIDTHQTDLKAKLSEKIDAERKLLVDQIDTKLADAVTSFLAEALQHDIDLGAQTPYMLKMLEEHKAELIKGVHDEV